MTTFNPEAFLNHVVLSLRNLDVDMTTRTSKPMNSIVCVEKNPKKCYKIELFGFTPDYDGEQPAHKTTGYYYPNEHKLFVILSYNGDWNDILFPTCNGMNPIEFALKNHGLVDLDMSEITVECD
ncbi:hypothetical protein ACTTZI_004221 [Vibrio vulnificus]